MSSDYTFEGWLGHDANAIGNMKWGSYEPKQWRETDVDIRITHCGICGTDLHSLRSGWAESYGPTEYPCVVGHELVGQAVKVGKEVQGIQVGDRVGVGAQSDSCHKCEECLADREQYCMVGNVPTYTARYLDGSGKTYGGYADYARVPGHFVIKIPDGVPSEAAGPLLCGGITIYSPLKVNGAGPGLKVGIVGIGGIGHFGVLFAKALGAERVVAISRTSSKKEDAFELGADELIATDEDKDWAKHHAMSLDLIISTVSSANIPLSGYLSLLRPHGQFINIGAPDDPFPSFHAFALIGRAVKIGGSAIGSPKDIREMLELVAQKGIKPMIEKRSMKDANQAVVDMENNKARYRYCLVNEKHLK